MLVMTRKKKQGIQIGEDIFVYVVEDKNGGMRIGIEAPKEINIRRLEVEDKNFPKL